MPGGKVWLSRDVRLKDSAVVIWDEVREKGWRKLPGTFISILMCGFARKTIRMAWACETETLHCS